MCKVGSCPSYSGCQAVIVEMAKAFSGRVPSKTSLRDAIRKLDKQEQHKLSHARIRPQASST